jgi:hypothetical protein
VCTALLAYSYHIVILNTVVRFEQEQPSLVFLWNLDKLKRITMKKIILACLIGAVVMSTQAVAKDDRVKFAIKPLLESEKAKQALLDVPVYFAGQSHAKPSKVWGEVSTNKKTNAFMKSDQEACEWVMLSALKALQERAKREGMNAVINIKSNYKHNEFSSSTEFECGAGNVMAGVALKGDLAKLP